MHIQAGRAGGHHGPLPELCVAAKLQAGAANTSNQVWVYCVTVTYHTASCCLIDQMLAPVLLCPAVRRTIYNISTFVFTSFLFPFMCMHGTTACTVQHDASGIRPSSRELLDGSDAISVVVLAC
jgi:hypothetical protein